MSIGVVSLFGAILLLFPADGTWDDSRPRSEVQGLARGHAGGDAVDTSPGPRAEVRRDHAGPGRIVAQRSLPAPESHLEQTFDPALHRERAAGDVKRRVRPASSSPVREEGYEVRQLPGGYMRFRTDDGEGREEVEVGSTGPEDSMEPDGSIGSDDPMSEDPSGREGGVILVPASEAPGLSVTGGLSEPDSGGESAGTHRTNSSGASGVIGPGVRGRGMESVAPGEVDSGADGAFAGPQSSADKKNVKAGALPGLRCMPERARVAQRLLELRGIQLEPAEALVVLEEAEQPLSPHVRLSLFGLSTAGVGGTLLETSVSHDLETRERLSELVRCLERTETGKRHHRVP